MTPLRVLSIATLFPDTERPNFGLFVERSLRALAAQPAIDLTIVAPVGLPPWPLSLHPRYAALRHLPRQDVWNGLTVHRPHFTLVPKPKTDHVAAQIAGFFEFQERQAEREEDGIDGLSGASSPAESEVGLSPHTPRLPRLGPGA